MEKIQLVKVSKIFSDSNKGEFTALRSCSLEWNKGECIAVVGESGSGKSTMGKLITGLIRPTEGEILIDGTSTKSWNTKTWREHRKSLQAIFQDSTGTLNPGMSTYHNAEEALKNLSNTSKRERKEQILHLMSLMELDEKLLNVPPLYLSGGEQRRLGLLRSLVLKPNFLVLDEVTAGLDLISTEAVLRVLENYRSKYECSYFVITHDEFVATRLCNKMIQIERGEIINRYIKSEDFSSA